jgi:hypothetical protein
VRRRKEAIRARVKGDLPIVFTEEKLSAYGGLELFRRFLDRSGFTERLKQVFSIRQFDGDSGSFRVTLALIGMLLLGDTRLRHLRSLERDPLFPRFARLHRLPTDRTVSNTLKETTREVRERLGNLLREVAYDTAREARLSRITTPMARCCAPGCSWRGPREGNVHDSEKALETLEGLVEDVRRELAPRDLEARFDGAFFRREILAFLQASGIEYGIKAPLWDWLGIRAVIGKHKRWKRIAPGLQGFFTTLPIPKWKLSLRVAVYRKHVSHRTRKNFQLDLFDPADGHFEYSAVATNKRCGLRTLWAFVAGRGGHEKTLCELKQHLAFDTIPPHDWDANSTWQLISALTHNVFRQFQICTTAARRANGRKRTYRWILNRRAPSATRSSTSRRSSPRPRAISSCASPPATTPRSALRRSSTRCPRPRSLGFISHQG